VEIPLKTNKMQENQYRHILVLDRSGIGDLVMLIPLLKTIKTALPESVLSLAVNDYQLPIAKSLERVVDEVNSTKAQISIPQKIADVLYSIGYVRKSGADVLIAAAGGYRNSLTSLMSGAQVRVNPHNGSDRPFADLAYTHNIHPALMHCVDRNLSILSGLGLAPGEINFDFGIPDEIAEAAKKIADQYGIGDGPAIGVNPLSGQPWKNWPSDNMLSTVKMLSHDLKYKVVIFGKGTSAPITDKNIVDLRGKTGLLIDAYLQRYSGLLSLVIGVDTGLMHIAGSVNSDSEGSYDNVSGNRTLSLFGPTEPTRYAPYDPTHRFNIVIHSDVADIVRNHVGYLANGKTARYMNRITPKMVLDKVEYLRSIKAA